MRQKQSYTVKSSKLCECGCGKFLKQNLVDKNPNAKFIYKHFPNSQKNRQGTKQQELDLQAVEQVTA